MYNLKPKSIENRGELMKKIIVFLLLTFVVVSGCSNKGSSSNGSNGDEKEITVWAWDVAAATLEKATDDFQEEYPEVEVNVQDIGSGDLYEKLTVSLVSKGEGMPDVVLVEDELIPGYINQFPDAFANLSDNGYEDYENLFNDAKMKNVTFDDNIMAAPWDIGTAGVFYRTDIFEEAGIDADEIETWDDYLEAGKKVVAKTDSKMIPIDIPNYDGVFAMMMHQQGLSYIDENGDIALDSEESIRSMEMIKEFYENDIVLNNSGWDGMVTATVNGDVATIPYGVWYSGTIMDQAPELEGDWDMMYLPAFEEGGTRYANEGGAALMVSNYSDSQESAYDFVEFITTDEDIQEYGFEEYGLFPSLNKTYDSDVIQRESEYFNNKPIFKEFADVTEEVPEINITEDYKRIAEEMEDTQARILLDDQPIEESLSQAIDNLKNEIED